MSLQSDSSEHRRNSWVESRFGFVDHDHTFSNLLGMERECARTVRSSSKASNPTFQPLIGSQEPTPEVLVPVIKLTLQNIIITSISVVASRSFEYKTDNLRGFPDDLICDMDCTKHLDVEICACVYLYLSTIRESLLHLRADPVAA